MSRSNDPDKPNLVWAKGRCETEVQLEVSSEVLRNLEDGRVNSKIGEYWGLIHGATPNGTGLIDAHALFRGVQRPRSFEDREDEEIFAYIKKPSFNFTFPHKHGGYPIPESTPTNSVFAVYVEFYGEAKGCVSGNVLYWEWILADGDLPKDHADRYSERIW
ncbi:MAG: hypothetical protein OXP36_04795 [Gammaproteobacteria bacterium]|nr:hypothetical protein [Gammaproteobacteria bacterium]